VVTENAKNFDGFKGWVFYDGDCPTCQKLAKKYTAPLRRHGYVACPLQEEWVTPATGLSREAMMLEMKVVTASGDIVGGADAFMLLMQGFWWLRPIGWVSRLPGMMKLFRAGYRWFASRRYCMSETCPMKGGTP
jgi:predicted DCC family thiol-disulfide oxidoreductase YuxK